MPQFVTGLDLNEQFFHQVVRPLLCEGFPQLSYAAARLGGGSDVLGFDTSMSTDHDWGIRMQLFLSEADFEQEAAAVSRHLHRYLPHKFLGYPVHFGPPNEDGTRMMAEKAEGPVDHRIEITTLPNFLLDLLHINPLEPLDAVDWLTIPQQFLLEFTAGRVFWDEAGQLEQARQKLATFPHDVWLYLLGCQWMRISQEEHLMGRAGFVGDDIGSRLVASRLVHDIMLLCFLMEQQYAPYPKWFGSAFTKLACAEEMSPILTAVLQAETWQDRGAALCHAYRLAVKMHNRLQVTEPQQTECVSFFERPFSVIFGERIAQALFFQIQDPQIKQIQTKIGSIDQFSHSTDLRSYPNLHRRLRSLYFKDN